MAEQPKFILQGTPEEIQKQFTELLNLYQLLQGLQNNSYEVRNLESVPRKGKPKVTLYFIEDLEKAKARAKARNIELNYRKHSIISFRLMDESPQTFSEANGKALARKIKETFGANNSYIWEKGKIMYSYTDWENGFQFQLLCKKNEQAKKIITDVMDLRNMKPNWQYLFENKNDQEATRYPENPGTQTIMGKTIAIPQYRPIKDVHFSHASIQIDPRLPPVVLYSRINMLLDALIV